MKHFVFGTVVVAILLSYCNVWSQVDYLHHNIPQIDSDHYCGAYAVWHALYHFGKRVDINDLVEEMNINDEEGCSIYDVVCAFKKRQLKVRAVRLDNLEIQSIRNPFIPFIGGNETQQGHFVFCIPLNSNDGVLVIDGDRSPFILSYENIEYKIKKKLIAWNGEAVIIGNTGNNLKVMLIAFLSAMAVVVYFLFERSSRCKR